MKTAFFTLILLLSPSLRAASSAWGEDRQFQLAAGFGVAKNFAFLEDSENRSNFSGWTPGLDVGLDIPIGNRVGLLLGAELRQLEMTNSSAGSNYIEKADGFSRGVKAGFYLGRLGLGGGISRDSLTIKQVSATTGASEIKLDANTNFYFANLSFGIKPSYRLTFEGQYRSGDLNGFRYSNFSAGMNFYLLFDL